MIIEKVSLVNVRKIKQFSETLSETTTIITGKNGTGKTSKLQAELPQPQTIFTIRKGYHVLFLGRKHFFTRHHFPEERAFFRFEKCRNFDFFPTSNQCYKLMNTDFYT